MVNTVHVSKHPTQPINMPRTHCLGKSVSCLLRARGGLRSTVSPISARPLNLQRHFADQRRTIPSAIIRESDKLKDFTRDEQIDTPSVQLKGEDDKIQDPQPLRDILRRINRETHCIVQLSKPGDRDIAVVQIRAKMDLLKQLRDKEHQMRQIELARRVSKPKQIELNWAISENDLNLKLKQMESFLEKGKTVEVILAAKKRQRKASEDEGGSVLKKIKQTLQDIGAKEVKPMQGQILKQATLVVKK